MKKTTSLILGGISLIALSIGLIANVNEESQENLSGGTREVVGLNIKSNDINNAIDWAYTNGIISNKDNLNVQIPYYGIEEILENYYNRYGNQYKNKLLTPIVEKKYYKRDNKTITKSIFENAIGTTFVETSDNNVILKLREKRNQWIVGEKDENKNLKGFYYNRLEFIHLLYRLSSRLDSTKYYEPKLSSNTIFKDDGTYSTSENIINKIKDITYIREQLCKDLAEVDTCNTSDYIIDSNYFTPNSRTYALFWAYDNKIATGYSNNYFGAFEPITKKAAITFLYRYHTNYVEKN